MNEEQTKEIVEYIRVELNKEPGVLKHRKIDGEELLYIWEDSRGGAAVIVAPDKSYLFANSSISFDEHLQEFRVGNRTKSFVEKEDEASRLIDEALKTILDGSPEKPTKELRALLEYGDQAKVFAQLIGRLRDIVEEDNNRERFIPVSEFKGNAYLPYTSTLFGQHRLLSVKSNEFVPMFLNPEDSTVFLLATLASFLELSKVKTEEQAMDVATGLIPVDKRVNEYAELKEVVYDSKKFWQVTFRQKNSEIPMLGSVTYIADNGRIITISSNPSIDSPNSFEKKLLDAYEGKSS